MRVSTSISLALLLLPGCPGTTDVPDAPSGVDAPMLDGGGVDGGGSDGGGDAGGSTDGGVSAAMGDCEVDTDCPAGGHCIELVAGGYRVCQADVVEANTCEDGRPDVCCTSAECKSGACYLGPVHRSCGGIDPIPFNECASDECTSDTDCADGGVCAPAGVFGPVAQCTSASCRLDGDCTAAAGGHCVLAVDPCCGIPVGLVCTYDGDGCRSSSDCTTGYCSVRDGRLRCVDDGGPFCPA